MPLIIAFGIACLWDLHNYMIDKADKINYEEVNAQNDNI